MRIIFSYMILGIFVSLFFLYIINPLPNILLVTPKVNEKISELYQDDNNVCYRYHREEVICDKI